MNTRILPLVLLAFCLPVACKNTPTDVKVNGMEAGTLILKGGAGPSTIDSSTEDASQFDGDVDEEDTALSLGVGYTVHPNLSFELSFTEFGEFDYDGTWNGTPIEGTVESSGLSLAAVGYYPLNETFGLVGSIGMLAWYADEEENFGGNEESFDDNDSDVFYGAGVQANLTSHLAARLDYTFWQIWDEDVDTLLISVLYYF